MTGYVDAIDECVQQIYEGVNKIGQRYILETKQSTLTKKINLTCFQPYSRNMESYRSTEI